MWKNKLAWQWLVNKCARKSTPWGKCSIDDYNQQYLALPIPGSRLNARNAPGACWYCSCQLLNGMCIEWNRKVLFTQTKWIFLNIWYCPIRTSATTVWDKTTKFLFHLPCCWLPHKLFNFWKWVIVYHIQCFQFWFSLPADNININVDGVYRWHSNS